MLVAVLMLTGMLYQILREQMGDHLKKKKKSIIIAFVRLQFSDDLSSSFSVRCDDRKKKTVELIFR